MLDKNSCGKCGTLLVGANPVTTRETRSETAREIGLLVMAALQDYRFSFDHGMVEEP
jgi:hypothetical protein